MRSTSTPIPLAVAALRLGVTREVALRRLMRGELKGIQIGGRWMVDPASLLQLLARAQAA
ncbi:MAG: hypothetical protein ACYC3F_05275 [Gemmatimonadaceae bacterium]